MLRDRLQAAAPYTASPFEISLNLMKIIYYFGYLISGIFMIFIIRYTDARANKVGPQIACNFQSMQSHLEVNSFFFKFSLKNNGSPEFILDKVPCF